MPLFGYLREPLVRSGGRTSTARTGRERGAEDSSAGTTSSSARAYHPAHSETATRHSSTNTAGSSTDGSTDETVDEGPLYKLAAAYHRSLENGSYEGADRSQGSRQSRTSAGSSPSLVVREHRSRDRSAGAHALHASESRRTSTHAGQPTATARTSAADSASYDLGLGSDDYLGSERDGDYELIDPAAFDDEDEDNDDADDDADGELPPRRAATHGRSGTRYRDKPRQLLQHLGRSGRATHHHILSPHEGADSGTVSSLQGPSLSSHLTGFGRDEEFTTDEFDDDDDDVGSVMQHQSSLTAAAAAGSARYGGAGGAGSGMRRVDFSADSSVYRGAAGDDAAYGPDAEVAILRLDDEFYTSSELVRWRRSQGDGVGACFLEATPATLATTSDGSFPSSLCARTTTTTTTSSGEAVMVMRTASEMSHSVPSSSDATSDGLPPPASRSLVRHVRPPTSAERRALTRHESLVDFAPKSPVGAPPPQARRRWGRGAQMEDAAAATVHTSQSSESGLTSTPKTTGGSVTAVTRSAAPAQRRLSRPNEEKKVAH